MFYEWIPIETVVEQDSNCDLQRRLVCPMPKEHESVLVTYRNPNEDKGEDELIVVPDVYSRNNRRATFQICRDWDRVVAWARMPAPYDPAAPIDNPDPEDQIEEVENSDKQVEEVEDQIKEVEDQIEEVDSSNDAENVDEPEFPAINLLQEDIDKLLDSSYFIGRRLETFRDTFGKEYDIKTDQDVLDMLIVRFLSSQGVSRNELGRSAKYVR